MCECSSPTPRSNRDLPRLSSLCPRLRYSLRNKQSKDLQICLAMDTDCKRNLNIMLTYIYLTCHVMRTNYHLTTLWDAQQYGKASVSPDAIKSETGRMVRSLVSTHVRMQLSDAAKQPRSTKIELSVPKIALLFEE
mmetsp:Transcript_23058/g.51186  ORF Transcript_23058/g.51186 Transcript_23058/m.51186 type:complete len:136 (+) Transcript_23058:109-516(+)